MKNTNIAVHSIKREDIFHWWLVTTRIFHRLTEGEMKLVEAFLREEYELRESISNPAILRKVLYATESRKKIMDSLNLNQARFNNLLTSLRSKGVFKGKELNSKFFPNLELDAKDFKVIFQFKFNG